MLSSKARYALRALVELARVEGSQITAGDLAERADAPRKFLEAILLELTKKGFMLLAGRMREARDKQTDLAAQIEAMWLAYWNFAFEEKEYYQLMFGVEMNCCIMDEILPAGTTPYDIAAGPIAEMMGISDIEDDRVCTKYYTYWSIIHGLISINIVRKGTSDEINRQILRDAITGITRSLKN